MKVEKRMNDHATNQVMSVPIGNGTYILVGMLFRAMCHISTLSIIMTLLCECGMKTASWNHRRCTDELVE